MPQPQKGKSFLKKIISFFTPPQQWRFTVIILLGILFGLGAHILYVSNAVSYLSNDPNACINCHVMTPQYATWERSSHAKVATCNDCHVPHDNFIRTYYFKAMDGLRHATMFTFRLEPQVIRIKEAGRNAVQENCIRCHSNQIHPIALRAINNRSVEDQRPGYCWDCHREVPHGRARSLSSVPHAQTPDYKPIMSDWLENFFDEKK
jgi:cytochrome c nitrite reductase small subunit